MMKKKEIVIKIYTRIYTGIKKRTGTMKDFITRCFSLLMIFVFVLPRGLAAQNNTTTAITRVTNQSPQKSQVIAARSIEIGCAQTCMLVFPSAIQSADRGAAYVLAQRVKGAENALKVKAGKPGFAPSSLTVITTDGQVFAFKVSYASRPDYLVLDLRDSANENRVWQAERSAFPHSGTVTFKDTRLNSAEMEYSANQVKKDAQVIKGGHKHKYGVAFKLDGIYFYKDVLFFRFRLHNSTAIPYQAATLRFFIRDAKRAKRTAVQDSELPVLFKKSWGRPEDSGGQIIIMALPRFTIADNKHLAIQLMEQEGDRTLDFRVRERTLRKTKKITSWL